MWTVTPDHVTQEPQTILLWAELHQIQTSSTPAYSSLNDPLWTRRVLFKLSPEESDGGRAGGRGTAWRSQLLQKKIFLI